MTGKSGMGIKMAMSEAPIKAGLIKKEQNVAVLVTIRRISLDRRIKEDLYAAMTPRRACG